MSDSDSESEVFWGPVTMKEIKATLGIPLKDKPQPIVNNSAISIDSIEETEEIDEKNDSIIVIDDDSIEEISDTNDSLNVSVDPLTLSEDENSSVGILKINASNNSFQETIDSFNYSKQFNKIDIDSYTPNNSVYSNNDNDFDPLSISEHKNKSCVKPSCSKNTSKSLNEQLNKTNNHSLTDKNDSSCNSYIDLDPNDSELLNTSKISNDISVNKTDSSSLYIDLDSNESDILNTSETVSNKSIDNSVDQTTNFNISSTKSFTEPNFEYLNPSETEYNKSIDTSIVKNEIDQITDINTSKLLKTFTDFEYLDTNKTANNRTIDSNKIDQLTDLNTSTKSFTKSNVTNFDYFNTNETTNNRTIDSSIDTNKIDQLDDINISKKSFKTSNVTNFEYLDVNEPVNYRSIDTSINTNKIDQITDINTSKFLKTCTNFEYLDTNKTANNRTIDISIDEKEIDQLTDINISSKSFTTSNVTNFEYLDVNKTANNRTIDISIDKKEIDQLIDINNASKSFTTSHVTNFGYLNTNETVNNRTVDTSIDKNKIDQLIDINTSKLFKTTDFDYLNTSKTGNNKTIDTSIDTNKIDQLTDINISNLLKMTTDFEYFNTSETVNNKTIDSSFNKKEINNTPSQSFITSTDFEFLNTNETTNNKTSDISFNKKEIDQQNNASSFKHSDIDKNEYSIDKMYNLQSMETSLPFNNYDKITPRVSNVNESFNNDISTNTSKIESLNNTSYSDNSNLSELNDTLEEVERLLQYGLKYKALQNECDVKKDIEIKPIEITSKIPLIKIQKENTPLKCDNQFKVPISSKNKNKFTTPRNKTSKFNDIISPVGLYIKNSASTPVIRNVQIKNKKSPVSYLDNTIDDSLVIPASPIFPQECALPKRVYQSASKVITKSETSKMVLPNSIKKYMPKTSPVVIKQERGRSPNVRKQILKSSENSVCEISLDSTTQFNDVSFRTVKPAVVIRKH